eukprot:CAMPEP_0174374818 /NCGR_PEP_ID=MMETSP0811_2-20130205/112308_1 /TAXON_ID=73025 ORGANISM="Eutreptiella gymnastica-like, Strain CCMP1594" /NCGR_SAMPLE_ID=MMETSP0811_2 /ASSEMBLY_ACC=CAM_ASM_000667 /LENGTH=87 /DNA_ID=CAMNT_0015524467 /DNA_START=125 /DNA_END=385 /DNA_ORIENTATION=-
MSFGLHGPGICLIHVFGSEGPLWSSLLAAAAALYDLHIAQHLQSHWTNDALAESHAGALHRDWQVVELHLSSPSAPHHRGAEWLSQH